MVHTTRIKVAALATALFIGGLSAAGIGLRSTPAKETATAPAQAEQAQRAAIAGPTQMQPAAPPAADDEGGDGDYDEGEGSRYGLETEDD
jgi:hypothetical protein